MQKGKTMDKNKLIAERLSKIILDLEDLCDSLPGEEEPDRPKRGIEVPEIIKTDIIVKTHGNYRTASGQAKGLVVHYTSGRSKEPEAAINTLNYLARQGLGCLVMDREGKIYRAENQELNDVAYHAGKSEWKGFSGISRYCIGMEICCAGQLDGNRAWFGQRYTEDEIREVGDVDNVRAGRYHKFTEAQELSLKRFCRWQLQTNPEFDIDWIVGHDEISPGRKTDPGGSLSVTMTEFRDLLR